MIDPIWIVIIVFCLLFWYLKTVLEYDPGTGKSEQLLHDKHLYYRISEANKFVCTQSICFISLTINEDRSAVARKPKKNNHDHLTACEIAVKKAKSVMKTNLLTQL